MTQRSKDFRAGFLAMIGVLGLGAAAGLVVYDICANALLPSPSTVAGFFAALLMGSLAIGIVIYALLFGMYDPSKGEPSNGRDDA